MRPELGQVLLGLFILWQTAYMFVASWVHYVGEPPDPVRRGIRQGVIAYEDLTLQRESWGMFWEFPPRSTFPAVRLVWHATTTAPARVEERWTPLEPADPYHYFAPNLFADRRHNFDGWLSLVYLPWDDATVAAEDPRWQSYREQRLRDWWPAIRAYMQHTLGGKIDPPDEVILLYHEYGTPPPGVETWAWTGPRDRPLARWQPGVAPPAGQLPLQLYNPHTRTFDAVPEQP